MNRFFDFTEKQIKFIAVLSATAVILGGYLFVKSYALPVEDYSPLEVHVGHHEDALHGVFIIDPNTAPADSLELLPGIGKVLADRIVEYRKNCRFETEVDIISVNGIGPRVYERLKPYLKVRNW
jgi:DNA uptake protein ComE-like DNA-binding protein